MDFESDYGDLANFNANARTLQAVRQQTAALQKELKRQEEINADVSRKTDALLKMQERQMDYQKKMDKLRAKEEAAKKSLRQEMVDISSLMKRIDRAYD